MTTEILEREQKYEAEPDVTLPFLNDLPRVATLAGPEVDSLIAEYYDTDGLRLIRAGITLRRREGGTDEGWHLKLPEGAIGSTGTARREIRLPLNTPGDPVPGELARLVRVHTRGVPLRPVARIETHRERTTLRDSGGTSLAEVLADEVTAQTLGSTTTLSRWNEFEVELTGGGPELLREADKRLRHSGLRPAGYSAKLQRALATDLPRSASAAVLTRRSPAGEVVLGYLDEQAARLKYLDPAVRRDEPDSVHQMRVTSRRLRSTLQMFPMIIPKPETTHLREELKWLGGVLGEARDDEVLSELLRSWLSSLPPELVLGPALARVRVHFAPGEARARDAVLEALDSRRYFAMLDELDRVIEDPPFTEEAALPADEVIPGAVGRAFRRTKRRMRVARRSAPGPAREVALHDVRKAAKGARYAGEAAEPVFGKKARRFTKRMKAVQSVLGEHQDAVIARGMSREIGVQAHLAGENAFTFGLLYEYADRQAADRRRQAMPIWKQAARRKWRKWLA